jgi:hypothetical protein
MKRPSRRRPRSRRRCEGRTCRQHGESPPARRCARRRPTSVRRRPDHRPHAVTPGPDCAHDAGKLAARRKGGVARS